MYSRSLVTEALSRKPQCLYVITYKHCGSSSFTPHKRALYFIPQVPVQNMTQLDDKSFTG